MPEPSADQTRTLLIVFDTDCVLCSHWVQFVIRHERHPNARFISAWSDEGLALGARYGLSHADFDRTFLVISAGKALTKSDGALEILTHLRAPWRWLAGLQIIPHPIRDGIYDLIARHRYKIFGRRAQCFIPPEDQADRFISGPSRPVLEPASQ